MLGYEPILNSPMQFQLDEVNGAGRMNRTRGEIRSAKKAKLHRLLPYSGGLGMLLLALAPGLRAQCDVPTKSELHARGGVALITACEQEKHGDIYTARGNVEINYQNERLRAKQIDYNSTTGDATLTGDVKFDYGNQHISAQNGHYNVNTKRGEFYHAHGEVELARKPNPTILISANPLSFDAAEVDRMDISTYRIVRAQITVCRPDKPTWKFYSQHATLHLNKSVALVNANFRLFHVPLIWLPYANSPAGSKVRQSGFMIPDAGQSSVKGFVFGDSYYWAPTQWFDTTIGASYMSLRGSSQTLDLRATPTDNISISASYFGVIDRGIFESGIFTKQGGHQINGEFSDLLAHGWRAVADINELSSLTFRLAFSDTFGEAVNAEANSAVFATNNFSGFSLNLAAIDNRDFLSAQPQTSLVIRSAPEVRFGSVDQSPWHHAPVYFGFDADVGGMSRSDPSINTAAIVQRDEFAPRVTVPLHWGPWLGLTSTYVVRTIYYGAQLENGIAVNNGFHQTTGDLTMDLRPPSVERVWSHGESKWKHSIEPDVVYRYVNGVNDFGGIIRFDQEDTLTDTNEIQYGITNRLFRKRKDGSAEELLTWRLAQKYYFDPTFGGAIVPGQRNVFEALDDLTPFPFADGIRRMSPVVSDLTINPGGTYDAEFIEDYDTQQHTLTTMGTLIKMRPYKKFNLTLAHFLLNTDPVLQPHSDQVRALFGYGEMNGKGWNFTGGVSYDFVQGVWENEVAQIGYNGSCCGLAFEYRRLELPPIRFENQFRISLVIANIGTFGNIHKQEKIF
jgi:LPS-assembly protein